VSCVSSDTIAGIHTDVKSYVYYSAHTFNVRMTEDDLVEILVTVIVVTCEWLALLYIKRVEDYYTFCGFNAGHTRIMSLSIDKGKDALVLRMELRRSAHLPFPGH